METTLIGERRHSGMQTMGETREPMAFDCWMQAQELADKYDKVLQRDFWIMYAAKPHVQYTNAIVAGWEVVPLRPPIPIVGVLVFKWIHKDKRLEVDKQLSLPSDVPLFDTELSQDPRDMTHTLAEAAEDSGSILLA